jgi:hypothetical protein
MCATGAAPARSAQHEQQALLASGNDRPCGARARRLFTFEDELRPRAAAAVAALQQGTWSGRPRPQDRMRVLMLTGARLPAARSARRRRAQSALVLPRRQRVRQCGAGRASARERSSAARARESRADACAW